ncbi:hypothetical protein [Microbacterium sp. BH-3-3-3]|uniref:hypothetical protein n=1 Tax=Microbacterium sp. BH-3-3-3 TaxID=1906742 RepID=UPI00119E6E6E|nr:hypothetical protein [Microbacterium sp. BH-3-3-3]
MIDPRVETFPEPPSVVRRRTVLAGAAWAVPAVVLTSASPAFAASGARVSITQAPKESFACQATTGPLIAHVDSSTNAGQLVQFSLPSGWRWVNGSGSYVTDAHGDATVQAGDFVVGTTTGTVVATAAGSTAVAELEVTGVGALSTDWSAGAFPAGENSRLIRVYGVGRGTVAVKTTGDIWSRSPGGAWAQIGTAADTTAQAAVYIDGSQTSAALWVASGVLHLGSAAVVFSSGANSDFARVASCGPIAMAVKTNGEVWRWEDGGSWSQLDTGVTDDLDQLGPVWDKSTGITFYWIKGGVIFSSAGGPITLGTGQNSGVRRLYVASLRDGDDTNLVAVKTNGDVWVYAASTGWRFPATGAETGGEQASPAATGNSGGTALTIHEGVLEFEGKAEYVTLPSGEKNEDFCRVAGPAGVSLAVKRDGTLYGTYNNVGQDWARIATNAATGYSQMALGGENGARGGGFWISPASC